MAVIEEYGVVKGEPEEEEDEEEEVEDLEDAARGSGVKDGVVGRINGNGFPTNALGFTKKNG